MTDKLEAAVAATAANREELLSLLERVRDKVTYTMDATPLYYDMVDAINLSRKVNDMLGAALRSAREDAGQQR